MKNIVETVTESGDFKTLLITVQETGLVDTLSREGPFTVFAPTDEAFSKLPPRIFKNLLKDIEKLTEILTYHVVENIVMINDVINIKNAKTVNGKEISVDISKEVKIDNARIIKSDIECSNGVIHVIDEVLLPD